MTENLPAVRTEQSAAVVVARDTDSWAQQLPAIVELARSVCGTDFVPEAMRDNVAATAAAILYGREVSLPPMTALGNVNVIKGKPGLSAVIMRAQVLAAGHEIRQDKSDSAHCVMSGRRRGTDYWQTVTYTIDDARQAGLIKRGKNGEPSMYEKNPRRMLRARATSELCELMFADVVRGMPSLEELEELDEETPVGPPAKTTRATVQRKSRAKTDDGADASTTVPPQPGGVPSAAPSSPPPPPPPLPGEPGYDDQASHRGDAKGWDGPAPANGRSAGGRQQPGELDPVAPPTEKGGTRTEGGPAPVPPPGDQTDDAADPGREPAGHAGAVGGSSPSVAPAASSPDPEPEQPGESLSKSQQRAMHATFNKLDITDRAERMHVTAAIIGRDIGSSNDLTTQEASTLLDALTRCKTRDHVAALVQMSHDRRAGGEES